MSDHVAVSFVRSAGQPVSRADVLANTNVTEDTWNEARHELASNPEIFKIGAKQGTKYVAQDTALDLLDEAIADAAPGGASTPALLTAMADRNFPVDESQLGLLMQLLRARNDGQEARSGRSGSTASATEHSGATGKRTCPKCGKTGDIESMFGTRRTKVTKSDGTVTYAVRPQSWCRSCRQARPAGPARSKLAKQVVAILGKALRPDTPLSGWPLLADVNLDGRWHSIAAYLGAIGPSGRKNRPNERRIQNPSKNHPIEPIADRHSLLVGLDVSDHGSPVLVLWDAVARFGRKTRYSTFLDVEDLNAARTRGLSDRLSSNGERIIAFIPDFLPDALKLYLGDDEPMLTEEEDELDHEGLAATLSALSQGDTPDSFPSSPSPFEAEDIDWSSNEWLTFVREIQYWLRLDQEVEVDNGAASAANDLFSGLAVDDPDACYEVQDGVAFLTPLGFSRLDERLSLTQSRKDSFEQDLADDFGLKQATRRWLARWEDEPDTADLSKVEVHAKVTTWTIKWFMDLADAGRLELNPSYQRDVVWSNSDSQKLLDSVLRGIPLPSIILNQRKNSRIHEIVDGKQRLTAILRFMGRHPEGIRYAKEKSTEDAPFELFQSNYKAWKKKLGIGSPEERRHCLPFALSTYTNDSLGELSRKYYCDIREAHVTIQGSDEALEDLFEGPSDYKIPVILYQNTDLQQIHRVFGLYNKQGKQLNAEELRNAIYHHLDLTKMLLVLGGDSSRPDELVPFAKHLDLALVAGTLHELQVGVSRFHRTKLASWVAAILIHQPNRGDKGIKTPSTSGFINAMLEAATADAAHPMRDHGNLKNLATAMTTGAALMRELAGEEYAFSPKFVNKKGDGIRWEDLPTVAVWTACTLAAVVGKTAEDAEDISDAVREVTENRPPLEKQQSRTQWGYLARTTFELLDAMEIDEDELEKSLKQQFGFTCLPTLRDIDALHIKLV